MRFAIAAAVMAQTLPVTTFELTTSTLGKIVQHDEDPASSSSSSGPEQLTTKKIFQQKISESKRREKFLSILKEQKKQNGGYLKNVQADIEKVFPECDPESEDADVGVLSCGFGKYCVGSDESIKGGFCVSSPDELDRGLQGESVFDNIYRVFCVDGSSAYADDCNCTSADPEAYRLDVNCVTEEACSDYMSVCGVNSTSCITYSFEFTLTAPGTYTIDRCFEDSEPYMQKTCYNMAALGSGQIDECTISIDDVDCNSCQAFAEKIETCDENGENCVENYENCYMFDCTNTASKKASNICYEGVYVAPIMYYLRTYGCDYYTCPICGGDEFVSTNPGGVIDLGDGATTCAAVAQVAFLGGFNETFCQDVVIPGVADACGCVPFGSAPVPAPTEAPL